VPSKLYKRTPQNLILQTYEISHASIDLIWLFPDHPASKIKQCGSMSYGERTEAQVLCEGESEN
jgi:hypothetical protein